MPLTIIGNFDQFSIFEMTLTFFVCEFFMFIPLFSWGARDMQTSTHKTKIKLKKFLFDKAYVNAIVKAMNKKPVICGIVAVGPDNIIGCAGHMPWHSKQDLHYFKTMTMGYPCIFGKTTYENLPIKPLPGRLNIVCSSSYKIEQDGDVVHVPSLEEGIKYCGNVSRVFICGGAVLYKYALDKDLIDVMYLTRIHVSDEKLKQYIQKNKKLNTYFPYEKLDWHKWRLSSSWYNRAKNIKPEELPGIKNCFFEYTRVR